MPAATPNTVSDIDPPSNPPVRLSEMPRLHNNSEPVLTTESLAELAKLTGDEPPTPSPRVQEPQKPAVPPPRLPQDTSKPQSPPEVPDKGIKAVREALERATARVHELEASDSTSKKTLAEAQGLLTQLNGKVSTYEKEIESSYKPQIQKLAEVEKRLQEREELLRTKDFTTSPEWHEKYVKPVAEARRDAESLMSELLVNDVDGQRAASKEDFQAVLAAPNLNEAARRAKEMFGEEVYQSVVQHRNKILSLERSRKSAFDNAAAESVEHQKRQMADGAAYRERMRSVMVSEMQKIMDADPTVFKPSDEDKETKDALTEGLRLADLATTGDPNFTPEQFMGVVARARAGIAAEGVLRKRLTKLTNERDMLQNQLKEYQSSEPQVKGRLAPAGSGPTTKDQATEDRATMLAEAQKLASLHGM